MIRMAVVMLSVGLGATAISAEAQDAGQVQIGACAFDGRDIGFNLGIVCEVTNHLDVAISGIEYGLKYVEDGRTVPWASDGYSSYSRAGTSIPGGVEPSETVPVQIWGPSMPARANPETVYPVVELTRINLASGSQIIVRDTTASDTTPISPAANPGPPMTGTERDAFRTAVSGCWAVDPGSEAGRVSITVAFNLDRDGRVDGDIRLVGSSGGTQGAIDTAFGLVRRAIIRCQGQGGYNLPPEKFEQWRSAEMTFDPTGIRF